ncbi:MAG: hypothetical protein AB3N23_09390 [Paracoccaceae bacterium]
MQDDLKTAILNARYIDLIDLAGGIGSAIGAADDQLAGPEAQKIAAAMFRWAADQVAAPEAQAEKAA